VRFTDPDFGAHYSVDRDEIVGVEFAREMRMTLSLAVDA
jgi:hypothetical protein